MMKSRLKNILFFILLTSLLICWSSVSFADSDCSAEVDEALSQENINATASKKTKEALAQVKEYNNVVAQYINKCNKTIDLGTPSGWGDAAKKAAIMIDQSLISDITDAHVYRFTGIDWSGEEATTSECQELKNKAQQGFDDYKKTKNQARTALILATGTGIGSENCYCNSDGATCSFLNDVSDIAAGAENENGCEPFLTYLSDLSMCPLCPLFEVILNTDNELASLSWRIFSSPLKNVIGIFFAVYLALETLKIIGSMAGASISSYLKSVLGLGLKVAITYSILGNSSYLYDYFISPVIKGGLDMGIALLNIGNPGASQCVAGATDLSGVDGGVLDPSLLGSILQTVRCIGNSAALMPAIGRGLICNGWSGFVPDFSMWLEGIIMYAFGLIILLAISFYLIDCTIQLGMVCAVIPILVACWPFKHTTQYSMKGVSLIMNTFFTYVMIGVLLVIAMEIVGQAAGGNEGGFEDFIKALNEDNLKEIEKLTDLSGIQILILIACCIFAMKLVSKTGELADKFAQGSGQNMGAATGGALTSAATGVAKSGASIGMKIGGSALKAGADATGLTDLGNKVKDKALGGMAKVGQKVGLGKFQGTRQKGNPQNQQQGNTNPNSSSNNQNGGPDNTPNGGPTGNPNGGPDNTPSGGPTGNPNGGPDNTPNGGPTGNPNGGPDNTPNGGSGNKAGAIKFEHKENPNAKNTVIGGSGANTSGSADSGSGGGSVNNSGSNPNNTSSNNSDGKMLDKSQRELQNQFSQTKLAKQLRSKHLQATTSEQRNNLGKEYLNAESQFMKENASPEVYKHYEKHMKKRMNETH